MIREEPPSERADRIANMLDERFGGVIARDADRIAAFIDERDPSPEALAARFGGVVKRDARKILRFVRDEIPSGIQ
jgi:hypothetical protein